MFSAALEIVLTIAYREAVSRRHAYLTLEHLLYALAHDQRRRAHPAALRRRPAAPAQGAERVSRRDRSSSSSAARSASPSRRRRSGACCRPPSCTCRARSGRKCTPATSSRRSCSSRSRRRRGCSRARASRGSTCSTSSRTASRKVPQPDDPTPAPGRRRAGRRRRGGPARLARSAGGLLPEPDRPRAAAACSIRSSAAPPSCSARSKCSAGAARTTRCSSATPASARRRWPKASPRGCSTDDVPELLQGRGGLLARHRRAARRHALPRRLRGALQGRHQGARRAAARDSLHRRDPLDGRRRRDHRRHDGSGDADQADPHGRRPARHRIDDVRGVQAHREGPRARAPAAEDRDRRAVDRGDRPDSEPACARATRSTTT